MWANAVTAISYSVLAHVMLAADADSGACLGLMGGEIWNRENKVITPLRNRGLADLESRRWLGTAEAENRMTLCRLQPMLRNALGTARFVIDVGVIEI